MHARGNPIAPRSWRAERLQPLLRFQTDTSTFCGTQVASAPARSHKTRVGRGSQWPLEVVALVHTAVISGAPADYRFTHSLQSARHGVEDDT